MTAECPKCGNDSLMFGNIGFLFGVEPWCFVCDGEEE